MVKKVCMRDFLLVSHVKQLPWLSINNAHVMLYLREKPVVRVKIHTQWTSAFVMDDTLMDKRF